MGKNIFLFENILKLEKAYTFDKKEIFLLLELLTYLAATKEISLEDAECYSNKLFKMLEDVKP